MSKKQAAFFLMGYSPQESSYGGGVADEYLTNWFQTEDPVLVETEGEESTDEEEVKGYVGISPNGIWRKQSKGKLTIATKPNLDLLGFALKSIFANDTVTPGSGYYNHQFDPTTTDIEAPDTFSLVTAENVNDTDTYWKHNGCAVESLKVEWSIDNPDGLMTIEMMTDGEPESGSGFSGPAAGDALKGTRVRLHHLAMTLDGTDDVSSLLRSVTVTFQSEIKSELRVTRGSKVGEIFYGENAPNVSAEVTLKGSEGDTNWSHWNDGDEFEFDLQGVVATHDNFQINFPLATIPRSIGKIADMENGVVPVLKFQLRPVNAGTHYLLIVENDVVEYLGVLT